MMLQRLKKYIQPKVEARKQAWIDVMNTPAGKIVIKDLINYTQFYRLHHIDDPIAMARATGAHNVARYVLDALTVDPKQQEDLINHLNEEIN